MKKKWILLGVLFIILIIAITAFVSIKIYSSNSDEEWDIVNTSASSSDDKKAIKDLAVEIQSIYEDSTLYTSAGEKVLALEMKNWNNDYIDKINEIMSIVKEKANDKEFKTYKKFVIMTYFEKDNEEDMELYIIDTYNLPNLKQEESKRFIDFDSYTRMHDGYKEAMDLLKETY